MQRLSGESRSSAPRHWKPLSGYPCKKSAPGPAPCSTYATRPNRVCANRRSRVNAAASSGPARRDGDAIVANEAWAMDASAPDAVRQADACKKARRFITSDCIASSFHSPATCRLSRQSRCPFRRAQARRASARLWAAFAERGYIVALSSKMPRASASRPSSDSARAQRSTSSSGRR